MEWIEALKKHLEEAKKLLNENVDDGTLIDAAEEMELPLLVNNGIEDLIGEIDQLANYIESNNEED